MSSIQLEIPIDALSRPGVAKALADLTLALGGHATSTSAAPPKPALTSTESPPPYLAPPEPAPEAAAPAQAPPAAAAPPADVREQEAREPAYSRPAAAPEKRPAQPPAAPPAKAEPAAPAPEKSRSARPVKAAAQPAPEPERARRRGAAAEGGPARPQRVKKSTPPSQLATLPADERWQRYVADLPEPSRKFLSLLEERGQLSVAEAVAELNLSSPKAMGGLTGAMARWAPKQGVELPFEAREDAEGNRYWIWKG